MPPCCEEKPVLLALVEVEVEVEALAGVLALGIWDSSSRLASLGSLKDSRLQWFGPNCTAHLLVPGFFAALGYLTATDILLYLPRTGLCKVLDMGKVFLDSRSHLLLSIWLPTVP